MLGVDQSGVGRFRGIVPFSGGRFSARILRGGHDLEILVM
jgi:hypothetical protein